MADDEKAVAEKAEADKAAAADKSLDKFPPELRDHIRDLRREGAKRGERLEELTRQQTEDRKKLADYEKAEADRNRQKLEADGEFKKIADEATARAEKIERESKEALRKKDVAIIRSVLRSHAAALGIIDPDDVKDIDVRDLRVDDDGSVPGAKDAVEALKTKKPHWFKAEADQNQDGTNGRRRAIAGTPAGDGGGGSGRGNDSKNWDPARLKREWNTVKRV